MFYIHSVKGGSSQCENSVLQIFLLIEEFNDYVSINILGYLGRIAEVDFRWGDLFYGASCLYPWMCGNILAQIVNLE